MLKINLETSEIYKTILVIFKDQTNNVMLFIFLK